jgi:two-component system copper resistance phosphate regulon response regulator CusR
MVRILVIEDQKRLQASLRRGLEEDGYEVASASNGEEGYYLATTQGCEAVVLDLMLPGRNGLSVLKDLRSSGFKKPVLILTSRDAVTDRVSGLDAGADDYLVKPFAFAELVARLRALLRRTPSERELVLRAGSLELDLVAHRAVRNGVELDLSQREFELLEFLLRNCNVTVTREMISREVWKEPDGVWTNVIEVYINSLRKKVEQVGQRLLIHTVRGVGYVLRDA